jgi:hypothetical protein
VTSSPKGVAAESLLRPHVAAEHVHAEPIGRWLGLPVHTEDEGSCAHLFFREGFFLGFQRLNCLSANSL